MELSKLLLLKKEDLQNKYAEVFNEPADPKMTREQLAAAIANKTEGKDGKNEVGKTQDEKEVVKGPKLVHLIKTDVSGKVVDEIKLTESSWNKLPPNHKKEWKLKQPEELQQLTPKA